MVTILLSIILGVVLREAFSGKTKDLKQGQPSTFRMKYEVIKAIIRTRQFYVVTEEKTAAHCGEAFMDFVQKTVDEHGDHSNHDHTPPRIEKKPANKWNKVK